MIPKRWIGVAGTVCCAAAAMVLLPARAMPRAGAPASPTAGGQTVKKHQATGIVVTLTDTRIVIAKGHGRKKTNLSFVRTNQSRTVGILNRGAKVTVYYHEEEGKKIVDRVKVLEPAASPGAEKSRGPKP